MENTEPLVIAVVGSQTYPHPQQARWVTDAIRNENVRIVTGSRGGPETYAAETAAIHGQPPTTIIKAEPEPGGTGLHRVTQKYMKDGAVVVKTGLGPEEAQAAVDQLIVDTADVLLALEELIDGLSYISRPIRLAQDAGVRTVVVHGHDRIAADQIVEQLLKTR